MPEEQTPQQPRIPIVGIGASAGGLEALQHFFRSAPSDLGVAYVVIVHLAPDRDSDLASILGRETRMPVVEVGDETAPLERDSVYVIAPDRKLEMSDTAVRASRFEQPRGQRSAIDVFFRSLAAGDGEIYAVVLSGGGSDGSLGAKAVKEAGGLVLVQDPLEATHDSMPRAAIATGAADLVLPASTLAVRLAELVRNRGKLARLLVPGREGSFVEQEEEAALRQVLELLRRHNGHDFSKYKRNTIMRRMARRMQIRHAAGVREYLTQLEQDAEERKALFKDLLITVTTFFRDPQAWGALETQVLGPLVAQADPAEPIRCWVPGCATGEEAYTLAILFAEEIERRGLHREFLIFASDVDEGALAVGREGVYPRSIAGDVSEARLERWFSPVGDHVRLKPEIRDHVVLAVHSLQRDPPFSRLNLISCRNLLIYLDAELQDQVLTIFRYALRDDGYLFLGAAETASSDLFREQSKQHRIYSPREPAPGRKPAVPDLSAGVPHVLTRQNRPSRRPASEDIGDAHRAALEQAAPPTLLVDDGWNIAHLSETAGRFLEPRGGPATHSVIDAVRAELRDAVSGVLGRALRQREQALSPFVAVRFNGTPRRVAVLAQPRHVDGRPSQALLMFLEAGPASANDAHEPRAESERERALVERLRRAEQDAARASAEHHSAEEDLRAANEELQSLNEEYRSTTEELETSKEELQSINEELQTVNFELKSKLEEISRSHNDLENLMAATDIGTLFLDRELCIKRFTPRLADVFNVKGHDLGRPIADITHRLLYDGLDRDARRVLSDLVPVEREIRTRDGSAFVVRLRPYRTSEDRIEGVVITLVDISELKQAEEILRESEERFRALVDASAQTVWTTDAEGTVVEDSLSWRAFTGQTYPEWKGWGWLDVVHPDDRKSVETSWREALKSVKPFVAEFRLYHAASREHRWTSVRLVPLFTENDRVRGWVGMNIDLHERRLAEESLREADVRKDEFLGMLGHELRNPLAAIRNSIELAAAARDAGGGAPESEVVRRALAVIDRQSRNMTRLVGDLLDLTRITRDKLELQPKPTDLRPCLDEVVEALRAPLDASGLTLAIDLPYGRLCLDADPERLVQVLDNLLRNSITYTEPGGRLSIAARAEGRQARITVKDTGIGFDPAESQTLFEPYRQADPKRKDRGLGLGLALVKRLVEMHGGKITARSEGHGAGSEFEFTWPLASEFPQKSRATETPAPAAQAVPRRRILVVEDQVDVADSFAALLEGMDQDVRVAYGGEAALELAEEHRPQVAFLDLSMPGMSGHQLARRLRERFPADQLVLVALSGHGRSSAAARGDTFQYHLLKPAGAARTAELLAALPEAGAT